MLSKNLTPDMGIPVKGPDFCKKKKLLLKSKILGEEMNIQMSVIINMHYTAPCLKPELEHLSQINNYQF